MAYYLEKKILMTLWTSSAKGSDSKWFGPHGVNPQEDNTVDEVGPIGPVVIADGTTVASGNQDGRLDPYQSVEPTIASTTMLFLVISNVGSSDNLELTVGDPASATAIELDTTPDGVVVVAIPAVITRSSTVGFYLDNNTGQDVTVHGFYLGT